MCYFSLYFIFKMPTKSGHARTHLGGVQFPRGFMERSPKRRAHENLFSQKRTSDKFL
jgi:hypothetical protein